MSDRYFDKFPQITYSNNKIVDITRRVALLDRVSRNPYVFYNYEIESHERPDQLSDRYYKDSYKSWLIYLANKITDPYYEWYLSDDELVELVKMKYGTLYKSQNKIKYYRNDWENKEPISLSEYNALPYSMKKYWQPNYGLGSSILNYTRREVDWSTNTNKVISYTVSNTSFTKDEICNIRLSGEYLGKGQVVQSSNNVVYLQHVYGTFFTSDEVVLTGGSYIYGTESNCNAVVTAVSAISNNISEEELIYWKPITYYDYEAEINNYNKTVRLIDSKQSSKAVSNLRTLLET
jgi:hypothetical protein